MKKNDPNIKTKILLNPRYLHLHEFVSSLPTSFDTMNDTTLIRDLRNVLCRVNIQGEELVIKRFAQPSLFNRFIYGALRKSKSVRSYQYSMRLQELGFSTPEPVASVDSFRSGRLLCSFYISRFSDYSSLDCINSYSGNDAEMESLLDALCDHFIALHNAGVLYNDLNILNILYRKREGGGFDFQFVDTNRISFHKHLTRHQRVKDLRRLSCSTFVYSHLLNNYASKMGYDKEEFQMMGLLGRLFLIRRNRLKSSLKLHK